MAATRKTAMPPPPLPPLEAGTASTGDEANVHNNRYEHKHNLNTFNTRGQERASCGNRMFARGCKIYNEELRQKFRFFPNFQIIIKKYQ
jgi:hypothetical protein